MLTEGNKSEGRGGVRIHTEDPGKAENLEVEVVGIKRVIHSKDRDLGGKYVKKN